ncbi:MAG: PilZ domain-containing protein [Rhizobiaceae bacterium]
MPATKPEGDTPELVERSTRRRVLQGAHAAFNDEFCSVPCLVKNISQTGALLEFKSPDSVPTNFVLHVALDQYKIECRIARKDKNRVAVEFCGEKQKSNMARYQSLEMSNNHLSAAETKEAELRDMLQQRRQESLQNIHLQEKKAEHFEVPEGQKATAVFGKRV